MSRMRAGRPWLLVGGVCAVLLVVAGLLTWALLPGGGSGDGGDVEYDLVIENGRVIDPQSGLDAIRNVGIDGGTIAAVSTDPLAGRERIDASGLVVAPGFIDIHSHALNIPSGWMQAHDGVTTTLELERGAWPLAKAYEDVEAGGGMPINYGFAVSWADARMDALGEDFDALVSQERSAEVLDRVEQGLQEGAIGVGLLPGYLPESNRTEYLGAAQLAADYDVPTFTHVRGKFLDEPNRVTDGYGEVLAAAAATGAHMHICHLSSSATHLIPVAAQMIATAQEQGLPITTETYPYGAGSTVISAPFLRPDQLPRLGLTSSDIVYLKTGERPATDERLAQIQAEDPTGLSIIHYLDPDVPAEADLLDQAVGFPDAIFASDAQPFTIDGEPFTDPVWPLPEDAVTHPRSVGTFSRIMGRYVRERGVLTLPEAIRRATYLPARLLEDSVPQMRSKGRISVGADADVVVFDPDTIEDRATFEDPRQPSVGVEQLLVGGEPVIADGELREQARPGTPVRGPERERP